jgi:thiaminase/transcriptional activator TenA
MKWSEHTWQTIKDLYQSILKMPFIKELSEGSLPQEKFRFYMAQDSLYLEHFGRTLSLIAAKITDLQDVLAFMRFAENAIVVENALHESYFKDFGLNDKGILQPACHHYIHFLRSTAALESVEIAVAAVLPCFWIYREVGDYIYVLKYS